MGDLSDYEPQITTMRDTRQHTMAGGRAELSQEQLSSLGGNFVQVGRRGSVKVIRGDSSPGATGPTHTEMQPVAGSGAGELKAAEAMPAPTERETAHHWSGTPSPGAGLLQFSPPVVAPQQLALPPAVPKVKVTISSRATGKMTLFCTGVAVSDTILVIQYPADGQTAIYEPPTTEDDADPLMVVTPQGPYRCLSLGFSVELNGQYLVILVRLLDSPAALG